MRFFHPPYISTALLALAFVGCASKPPQYTNLPSGANPEMEIQRTEEMITAAREQQVDVLSPRNFTNATKALEKAKAQRERGKESADILEQVAYSRGWLNEANTKATISEVSMKKITEARAGALRAKTSQVLPKEWQEAEADLQNVTAEVEKGDLRGAEQKGDKLTQAYQNLERKAVVKAQLSAADENIKAAKKMAAEKKTPKSWALAGLKYQNAERLIFADPKNDAVIAKAAEEATRESLHLTEVTRKVNAGNSEDLVLMAERQQRTISNLKDEYSSTEQQLQQSQTDLQQTQEEIDMISQEKKQLAARQKELERVAELNKKAAQLRKQFKPNEAEVYTESGKLMVRLKGLQFPSNQATLGPKNQALLKKVDAALGSLSASKITIEGHTDATGSPDRNTILSEQRAQAVESYLTKNGTIAKGQVEAVGMGPNKPISDNDTVRGRAENRRIDMVIETE